MLPTIQVARGSVGLQLVPALLTGKRAYANNSVTGFPLPSLVA